jgi:hypothetical protein
MPFGPKLSAPPTIEELTAFHAWLNRPEEMRSALLPLPDVVYAPTQAGNQPTAEMVPDGLRDGCSKGEQRLFAVLQRLPNGYVVYHESGTDSANASFLVIGPDFGLLVIKCVGWRASKLAAECAQAEGNPVTEAQARIDGIATACASEPGFDVLVAGNGNGAPRFIFPCGYLTVFSNITQSELENAKAQSAFPPSQTTTRDVLESWRANESFAGQHVVDILHWYMRGEVRAFPLTDGQIRTLRAVIHPEIRLAEKPEPIIDGPATEPALNIDIAVLDLRQERHARSLGSGHRLIYGIAGSGKTVLLIARARYLASQHPEQHILLLCFNVTLACYLRKKLEDWHNVSVCHFDDWSIANDVTRDQRDNDELGERLLAVLTVRGDDARVNDTVLIDEAQDFSPSWFRCVLATMKDPLDGDLVIVSDASQGLYRQTGVSWKSLGIRAQGRTVHAKFDLDRNYRNTREILELARHFASPPTANDEDITMCMPVDPAMARRSNGMMPVLFKETFRTGEWKRVVKLVQGLLQGKWMEDDLPGPLLDREIGILYPVLLGQDENEFRHFREHLEKVTPFVWLTPKHRKSKMDPRTMVNEPGVKVQTIHSAKGLEYRAVIVMWADQLPMSWLPDYNEAENRRLMYVALTRAQDFLAITCSRSSTFIEEIRQSGCAIVR